MNQIKYKVIEMNAKAATKKIRFDEKVKEIENIVNCGDIILINEFAGFANNENNTILNYSAYFDNRELEKENKSNQCIIYVKKDIISEKFEIVSIGKDIVVNSNNDYIPDFIHIKGKLKNINELVNIISFRITIHDTYADRRKQFDNIIKYLSKISMGKSEIYIVGGDHNCGHMSRECFNNISNCENCNYVYNEQRKDYSSCYIKHQYEKLNYNFLYNKNHGTMFNSFLANYDFIALSGVNNNGLSTIINNIYYLDHIPVYTFIYK